MLYSHSSGGLCLHLEGNARRMSLNSQVLEHGIPSPLALIQTKCTVRKWFPFAEYPIKRDAEDKVLVNEQNQHTSFAAPNSTVEY
jgi:hypothetical protein